MRPLLARLPTKEEPLELLRACHRRVEDRLVSLERAAAALAEPGHPSWAEAIEAVGAAAHYFHESAHRHHEDEEQSLFPRLVARAPELADEIARLVSDHRALASLHAELRRVALALIDPDETPRAAARLPGFVVELAARYREHIRREEEIVLPRAAALLGAEELRRLAEEMAARRA